MLADGVLTIIDEVHTPDSSRYWRASTVDERLAAGEEPENLDKEYVRLAYVRNGYDKLSDPWPLPESLAVEAAGVYQETYTALTGRSFTPAPYPAAERVIAALHAVVD